MPHFLHTREEAFWWACIYDRLIANQDAVDQMFPIFIQLSNQIGIVLP